WTPSRKHIVRPAIMVGLPVRHRPDHANLVRHLRGLLEMLAKMDAFDARLYAAQRPPILDRGQYLRIKRFLRRNPARQENIDHRLRPRFGDCGLSLQLEKIAQRQPNAAEQPYKQEFAPIRMPHMLPTVAKRVI